MADKGKGKKQANNVIYINNSNSNVENLTNTVANLKRRLGLTTQQALIMLANMNKMPGSSQRHRAAAAVQKALALERAKARPSSSAGAAAAAKTASARANPRSAAQLVMNSYNLSDLLARKMNSQTLATFGGIGRQQRTIADLYKDNAAKPAFFNTHRDGVLTRSRPSTKENRLKMGIPPQRGGARKHPRITDRMPAFRYDRTNREMLLQNLNNALMQRRSHVPLYRQLNIEKIKARLQQSLWAVTLNSPGSPMTRDMQSFLHFMEALPPVPPGGGNFFVHHHAAIMRQLRTLGKQALFIIAVHVGIMAHASSQHARMRPGGGWV